MMGDRLELHRIAEEFEAAWSRGETATLTEYLNRVEETKRFGLAELLLPIDLEYRFRAGQKPIPDDYRSLGPTIAEHVLKLLTQESLGLRSVSQSDEVHTNQLEQHEPTTNRFQTSTDSSAVQTIGAYKLIQEIGEGGMGSVWLAEQEKPIRRRVALKLIKAGLDSKQVIARFEAERHALALMDHPNIARIIDGGLTEWGLPFFVMELVKGVPITEYCDAHTLTPQQRLELFVPICQAIQHAHQKGIIHRDIKPSNVMVALYDDKPVPKVIDFGLAKATGQALTEQTLNTGFNVVGTPQYMSPEQAMMSQLDIDTRTDIYSLGVLLYELLAGSPPFTKQELGTMGFLEILRVIREDDPPRPSTKLSSATTLPSISANRGTEPSRLVGLLRNDLDWIVMKALDKDRSRRYETANGFAADINRYLAGEAVLAHPPSRRYRLKKFVRKYRGPVFASVLIVFALVAGIVGTTLGLIQANEQRRVADGQRNRAIEARNAEAQLRKVADSAIEQEKLARAKADSNAEAALQQTKLANRRLYAANMNLTQAGWDVGRMRSVLDLLRQHEPKVGELDLRGFEWYYWKRLSKSYRLNLTGHDNGVWSVAFSPDGTRLASASWDNMVRVWDSASGAEKLILEGHQGPVMHVAFSPDGLRLASASHDRTVKIWDAVSGAELRTLKGHGGNVTCVKFSPDGRMLASVSSDWTVKTWDAKSGNKLLTFKGHAGDITSLAFSPDGKRLASASMDESIKIWDVATGQATLTLEGHTYGVEGVAFSPDGRLLVSAGGTTDHTVRIWDTTSGKELRTLFGHTAAVWSVAFSPDGKRLASASWDSTIKIWDAATGRELRALKGHTDEVRGVAFSPDGQLLASASGDRTVKVWDTLLPTEAQTLHGHALELRGVAIGPSGQQIATASGDQTIKLWDVNAGTEIYTLSGHEGGVWSIAFTANGQNVASASWDRTIKIWDVSTGKEVRTLKGHTDEVTSVAISPNGHQIASASWDQSVRVWNFDTGLEVYYLKAHVDKVAAVAFSPNGQWLASGSWDKTAKIWDAASGRELVQLNGHKDHVTSVAFSPDGSQLASGSRDYTLRIWNVATGNELIAMKGHSNGISCVTFSPDGRRIASASWDQTVKLWDAETGQELLTLKGHMAGVRGVAFRPDGQLLVSVGEDSSVMLWDSSQRVELPETRVSN